MLTEKASRLEDNSLDRLIKAADTRGQYKSMLVFLGFIVLFTGWSAFQSTLAQRTSAVTQEAFTITAQNHKESALVMIARLERLEEKDRETMLLAEKVKNLEEKDREKEKRIKEVERICSYD